MGLLKLSGNYSGEEKPALVETQYCLLQLTGGRVHNLQEVKGCVCDLQPLMLLQLLMLLLVLLLMFLCLVLFLLFTMLMLL